VGHGSIIAARATVTGLVPPSSIAAGTPSRVIRTGISWVRDDIPTAQKIDAMQSELSQLDRCLTYDCRGSGNDSS